MMRRAPFPLRLAVRTHLARRSRLLTSATVFAVALSVALATALELAARGVEVELQGTADALAGAAELEITAGRPGIPEELLTRVQEVRGVAYAAPLVETTVRVDDGPLAGSAVHVLGVDLLADPEVRAYHYDRADWVERDPLRLIARGDSLAISRVLAERQRVGLGDAIRFRLDDRSVTLRVQAILAEGGVGDAFGGQMAIMDVYALQTLLAREGRFDRIDVVVDDAAPADRVAQALRVQVQGFATVRRAAARDSWVASTISAVRLVVWSLVTVGVLVAGLLSYTAISLSVDRRLRELAVLRAVGLEGMRVRRLVRVDAVVLCALGTTLGIGLGWLLSHSFIDVLSRISAYLQDVEIHRQSLRFETVMVGVVVGGLVGVLGSLEPALRATAGAPLDVLKLQPGDERRRRPSLAARRAGWVVVAAGVATWLLGSLMPAGLRILVIFALGLVGIGLLAAYGFPATLVRLRPLLERVARPVGRLVGAALLARPFHSAITVATLTAVVAGVTGALILVHSLSETLDAWTRSQYPGGVMITAGNPLQGRDREELSPEVVDEIRSTPGVASVFDHYTTTFLYEGEEVLLAGSSTGVLAERGRLPVVDGDPKEVAMRLGTGELAISDQFAGRFGVTTGDRIHLDTPAGSQEFRVAGIIRDYAGPAGSLNLDLGVLDRLWGRSGSTNLVVWIDGPEAPVIDEIRRRVGASQDLFFIYGEALERYASSVIGQFTRLLDTVAALVAILGGVAVLNLLLGSVMERRRELALLRATGATRAQLIGLILIDALILAATAGAAGIALGALCAVPMVTELVRAALSWWIDFAIDPLDLATLAAGLIGSALLAGLYPAWLASRHGASGLVVGEPNGPKHVRGLERSARTS